MRRIERMQGNYNYNGSHHCTVSQNCNYRRNCDCIFGVRRIEALVARP